MLGNEGIDSVIRTLQELGGLVGESSHPDTQSESASDLNIDLDPERLLLIERKAAELQSTIHAFHQLQRETLSAFSTSAEQSTCTPHAILASRSQSAASRRRLFWLQKAVDSVFDSLEEGLYANRVDALQAQVPQFVNLCETVAAWLHQTYRTRTTKSIREEAETKINHRPAIGTESELESRVQIVNQDADTKLFPFQLFSPTSGVYRLLIGGPEGAGKTHLCHEIEALALSGEGVKAHRPHAYGRFTGEMEDNVISLFCNSHAAGTHLLVVDDLDDMIGESNDSPRNNVPGQHFQEHPKSHASSRTLASFLAMMDSSSDENQWHAPFSSRISLVCTAKANLSFLDRFDHVHRMEPPNDLERKNALVDFLGLPSPLLESHTRHNDSELILMNLVSATAGMSYAVISQKCSSAIINIDSGDNQLPDIAAASKRLLAMKEALLSLTAVGLLSHIVDGYVDLRVSSGQELIHMLSKGNPEACPLLGHQSEKAWKELEWNIVIPISRAAELSFLTHGQEKPQGHTSLSGGVLLTGIPGSGKSTLSRHCAMFAASFLPSVKLIEVSCSSMIHKEVGSSERAIHRLFDFARSAMPCIVILDDVAIISSVRGKDTTREGTMDRVLSTLLHEMDGVANASSAGMAIIGVTNDAAKVDPALLRPGRLGRTVTIGIPDKDARRQIALRELESNFEEVLLSGSDKASVSAGISDLIAERTEGLSGASVVGLVRDAKLALAKAMLRSEKNWPEDSSLTEEFLRAYVGR